MQLTFRKGLDLELDGLPEQVLRDSRNVSSVAILGQDYTGISPVSRVAEDDRGRAGQVLFVNRKRPRGDRRSGRLRRARCPSRGAWPD